jgi:hypothetical protein
MRSLFLTLFISLHFLVSAQVESYQSEIISYLKINGTMQQYSDSYDSMFMVLKEKIASPDTPDELWVQLKKGKEKSIQNLISAMALAYRIHFTKAEIIEMTKFYKTSAAQKMISENSNFTEEDVTIINEYLESDIAIKVNSVRDKLSKDVSNVSEEWSRNLFNEKTNELEKAGFIKQD